MGVRGDCSSRTSTFGKAPNGCDVCASWNTMTPASGSRSAIPTTATPGRSRGMTAIEKAVTPVRRLEWQLAEVQRIVTETARVNSLLLHVPGWHGHLPGQHVDIRLTAEDGYQAQRSYSIASPPEDDLLAGDRFEWRGPIGGYFVWTVAMTGPLWLIAGGSGVAPLMAMLRHRARHDDRTPATLLYSSRGL